jgi:hypothetical protein
LLDETTIAPPGFEPLDADEPWDPDRHLEIVEPERVTLLDEWGDTAAGPTALSPLAITSPFRFLSDEGVGTLQRICAALEQYAVGDERIPKKVRGSIYRSRFLRGMYHDPDVLQLLRRLAQAPLEPHPVSHHAVHINYAPDDLSRNVDQWHRDATAFDYVLMVNDPRPMVGGRFEYFLGPVEEGRDLLVDGPGLPPERVISPEFPGAGWAVLQQGHRVLHRACRLEERYPRITIVASYWAPVPGVDDPTDLATLLKADPRDVALVEWTRYQALVASRRLEHLAAALTDFRHDPDELQARLRLVAAGLVDAADSFDSAEEGRLISYGAGT